RSRLGALQALTPDWDVLRPALAGEEQVRVLEQLQTALGQQPRPPAAPTPSRRALWRALRDLAESVERFNRQWHAFLEGVALPRVNELREGYNRYYVIEKECAVRSPRVARLGFRPLPPLTRDELTALLPPLPVPQLRR